jgi:AcrR family transcriptional regulator
MNHSHIDGGRRERLTEIAEAAVRVFTRSGYRRAQMSDVAKEAGVAPGTLYLYVESKEALFELALRRALGEALPASELPLPAPEKGALLEEIARRLARNATLPKLATALERPSPGDARAEFQAIVLELYDAIDRYHRALSLVDRSAPDWPELARIFYAQTRLRVVEQLAAYLERRIAEGELPEVPDPATAARLILETTAFFAMHRHNDPDAASITDEAARATVLHALANAFSPR